MKNYAEAEIFSKEELNLRNTAARLISTIPDDFPVGKYEELRCHELARAMAQVLDIGFSDGWYGMVNHSWCWTEKFEQDECRTLPNVLDVYAPGRIPQVQLISTSPHLPFEYRRGDLRDDIDVGLVCLLVLRFKEYLGPCFCTTCGEPLSVALGCVPTDSHHSGRFHRCTICKGRNAKPPIIDANSRRWFSNVE